MELSLEPGTCIDSIPEDIHCPVCDASFEEFSPIEDEIIYVDHTAHLSHIERQHIPRVVHQDVQKVEVCVGEEDEMHPSDQQHRISALYLVDDEGHIIEEIFIMPDEDPIAEFDIS